LVSGLVAAEQRRRGRRRQVRYAWDSRDLALEPHPNLSDVGLLSIPTVRHEDRERQGMVALEARLPFHLRNETAGQQRGAGDKRQRNGQLENDEESPESSGATRATAAFGQR